MGGLHAEHGCDYEVDLPEYFKVFITLVHCLGYPVIFFALCQLISRLNDFYAYGNYKITLMAFLFEWATVDYFICDHINSDWFVGPLSAETNAIHCIGNTCVVVGNAMLSLSLYPTHRGNFEPYETWALNIMLIIFIFLEPYFFYYDRIIALLLLIISGVVSGYRILHTFGSSIKCYAVGYMTAGALGGTCTMFLELDCLQVIHPIEASMFVLAALMFGLALRNFPNKDGKGSGHDEHSLDEDGNNKKRPNLGRLRSSEDSNSNDSNDSNDSNAGLDMGNENKNIEEMNIATV